MKLRKKRLDHLFGRVVKLLKVSHSTAEKSFGSRLEAT